MAQALHPSEALFRGEKPFPVIAPCDHYAGSEKLIRKALGLQSQLGPVFDVTCDCEDGAPAGREAEHARMVGELLASDENRHGRAGFRVHDGTHPHWRQDVDLVLAAAGDRASHVTLPKVTSARQTADMIACVRERARALGLKRELPFHVLIETHGALREVDAIAALAGVRGIDFGLMDFVSAHHGAIPSSAMRSPGQFEHPLVVRAKTQIAAAALGRGIVPAHNVSVELNDIEAIRADARRARQQFGFLRMWSIHPNQILPIVEAMRPDTAEVDRAAAILLAARAADWGPIRHEGQLHDRASYRYFWEVLRNGDASGAPLPDEARAAFFVP